MATYPQPRSLSVRSVNSFVRRRSAAFNQGSISERGARGSSSSSGSNILTVQVEDVDEEQSQPTVLLVQKRRRQDRARVPSLPLTPDSDAVPAQPYSNALLLQMPEDQHQRVQCSPTFDATHAGFGPVPPTPTNDYRDRPHTSHSIRSIHTTTSSIPTLPTPGFVHEDPFDVLPSIEYAPRSHSPPGPSGRPGQPSRTTSSYTTYTTKLKRPPAPSRSVLSTADRLTSKFPISQSVRGLSLKGSESGWSSVESFGSVLQGGESLGMEKIDRWTVHKWCLFLSVCTVFATGAAGLVCVLLTWFKGKRQHARVCPEKY